MLVASLILLLITAMLRGVYRVAKRYGRTDFLQLQHKLRIGSLLLSLTPRLDGEGRWKKYLWTLIFCSHITLIVFAFVSALACFQLITYFPSQISPVLATSSFGWYLLVAGAFVTSLSLIVIAITEQISIHYPKQFLSISQVPLLISISILFPIVSLLSPIHNLFCSRKSRKEVSTASVTEKLQDLLEDSDLAEMLEPQEKKLMFSFVNFKHRAAREIMVPRVKIFCLPIDTPLEEAAKLFSEEGYSRIPVYRETIDEIVGVLLYKDVLSSFLEQTSRGGAKLKIETILKPILYTPENKKISLLLQEFRQKQIHLAIVVDEYGGTEGIITIEDILEELVGEIKDEHDLQIEELFFKLSGGEAIIDAKMSIVDIEKKLGISIPPSPEYETIGGYIFWKAGSIPSKGWKLHEELYDLEVLSSNDRSIDKVKLSPRPSSQSTKTNREPYTRHP